jgi:hypothetical protein
MSKTKRTKAPKAPAPDELAALLVHEANGTANDAQRKRLAELRGAKAN